MSEEPSSASTAPAGWYPDALPGFERYWDGRDWTMELREKLDPAAASAPQSAVIAGFWRRTAAFALDGLLLGLIGSAIGFSLFDTMAGLGPWGRVVGFLISLVYFGLFDGAVGSGQTVGKRVLGVRVVDQTGKSLPVWKAMCRFGILAAPSYLNNLAIPVVSLPPVVEFLIAFVLFGLGAASAYLYVFNRATGQSVHDLAVGSFVVSAPIEGSVEVRPWRGHLWIATMIVLVALVGVGASSVLARKLPPGLFRAVEALNATGEVHTASVFIGNAMGPDGPTNYVTVNAVVKESPVDPDALMTSMVNTVVSAYPDAGEVDDINVRLTYGFDLGIATGWRSVGNSGTPAEWIE